MAAIDPLMDHLLALGHREIAFIRGREGFSYDIKEAAWRRCLADRGFGPAAERLVVIEQGNASEAIGQADEAMTDHVAVSLETPTAMPLVEVEEDAPQKRDETMEIVMAK